MLRTRHEWKELGFDVPLRCKPVQVEERDGKQVKLFDDTQTIPLALPGERVNWTWEVKGEPGNLPFLREQLAKAHEYKDAIIKLERTRRWKVSEVLRTISPEYAALLAEIETSRQALAELREQVSKANQQARRRTGTPEQQEAIEAAWKGLKSLFNRKDELAASLYKSPSFKEQNAPIEGEHKTALNVAYHAARDAGLDWGTLGGIDAAFEDIRKGRPPKYRDFDGTGSIRVQFQAQKDKPPLTWERIQSGRDKRIRAIQQGKYIVVFLRCGGRATGFVDVACPIVYDREMPIGTTVKEAKICCRRIGRRLTYSLCLSLARRGGFPKERADNGTVAVNLGWRELKEGVRVAYWVAADGQEGQLIIPYGKAKGLPDNQVERDQAGKMLPKGNGGNAIGYFAKIRELQRVRDERFDDMMLALSEYLDGLPILPDFLADIKPHLAKINSKDRILNLLAHWQENRIHGDEDIITLLCFWREKELHLFDWERSAQLKFERWRKAYYSSFCAYLRERYKTLILGEVKTGKMRRKKRPEEEEGKAGLEKNANLVSPSVLKGLLEESFLGCVQTVEAKDLTRECNECGAICKWDQAKELEHSCEHCGATWDQDRNHCLNLLARGEMVDETLGTARNSQGVVWDRVAAR